MKPEELKQQVMPIFNKDAIVKLIDLVIIFRNKLQALESKMDSIAAEIERLKTEEDPNAKLMYDVVKADRELLVKHNETMEQLKRNQNSFINVYKEVDTRLKQLEANQPTNEQPDDEPTQMVKLQSFCQTNETFTTEELAKVLNVSLSCIGTYLPRAIRKGYIQDTGEKKGMYKIYKSLITEGASDEPTD